MTRHVLTQAATIAAVIGASLLTAAGHPPGRRPDAPPVSPPRSILRSSGSERPQQYYVSPRGKPGATGTLTDPLDLATALFLKGPARPGDTIWLRGGTYAGTFVSSLTGTAAAPIQVRSLPGERATLDGRPDPALATLTIQGSDAVYRDFEVTNTSPARDRERGIGVNVFGPRVRIVNLVVHDTGNGIGLWSPAIGAELYGNIIYDVGWQDDREGKGHSMYVQNETGLKRIVDNVLFNGHGFGIHAYAQQGRIDDIHIEGNVSFNHGLLALNREPKPNILVGGWHVAERPALIENFTYMSGGGNGAGAQLGYWAGCRGARVLRNYLVGGTPIRLRRCEDVTMSGNRFYGTVDEDTVRGFPDNAYLQPAAGAPADIFIRPNEYERGRAVIVVFNWPKRPAIAVDLSPAGLRRDEEFEVRDVQDYFGVPVATGEYRPGRAVHLPMTRVRTAKPVGTAAVPHTTAEFGVFVVQLAVRKPGRR